jgi:translation initiation factor IF-1
MVGAASDGIDLERSISPLGKEEVITVNGVVVEALRNTTYRVQIDGSEKIVLATLSGKMRQHNIKVIIADAVEVEFSAYDLNRGRIVRRN